uniref:Uncharacterized protein n=1 Tax=Chlamydomonas euryale TaxID=1486919 RepID=A0A7R9V7H9_9CHLO
MGMPGGLPPVYMAGTGASMQMHALPVALGTGPRGGPGGGAGWAVGPGGPVTNGNSNGVYANGANGGGPRGGAAHHHHGGGGGNAGGKALLGGGGGASSGMVPDGVVSSNGDASGAGVPQQVLVDDEVHVCALVDELDALPPYARKLYLGVCPPGGGAAAADNGGADEDAGGGGSSAPPAEPSLLVLTTASGGAPDGAPVYLLDLAALPSALDLCGSASGRCLRDLLADKQLPKYVYDAGSVVGPLLRVPAGPAAVGGLVDLQVADLARCRLLGNERQHTRPLDATVAEVAPAAQAWVGSAMHALSAARGSALSERPLSHALASAAAAAVSTYERLDAQLYAPLPDSAKSWVDAHSSAVATAASGAAGDAAGGGTADDGATAEA